jgi:MazG family protein
VAEKLTLRHPHVFGDRELKSAKDVLDNWDTLKANERKASGKPEKAAESILDEVPVHFPALLEGLKLTKRAAKVGFDWQEVDRIFDKLEEEVVELKDAIKGGDAEHISGRGRRPAFCGCKSARRLDVEPETALKKTNRKFRRRFKFIEKELALTGKSLEAADLAEMDALWDKAKA